MRWAAGSARICMERSAINCCRQALSETVGETRRLARQTGEPNQRWLRFWIRQHLAKGAGLLSSIDTSRGLRFRWTARAAAVTVALGSLTAMSADLSAAQAAPAKTNTAVVVKVVTRAPFGKMLATVRGRSLYIKPRGGCTGTCLSIWPPLLMPKGTTVPRGVRCLKTARFGRRLQVTYRGKRLYLFSGDSGTSVNGNNVGGFKVAKVMSGAC